ncbi:hypothetical protein ElyMa_004490700 [Elysia marginata]|uniref:Uncharacterized protein n=1 Tax=Elysia marginata TaxID=1093978 RepID=A0AAV4HMJ8_9GAST|nr:hypothetical protein ElyMa_004490700 [Elysia marginata]
MSEQKCKKVLYQPYHERSVIRARNNLKNYVDQLVVTNPHRGSLKFLSSSPNHPNEWEGKTGMMEHVQSAFPMPPKRSMPAHHQESLDLYIPTLSSEKTSHLFSDEQIMLYDDDKSFNSNCSSFTLSLWPKSSKTSLSDSQSNVLSMETDIAMINENVNVENGDLNAAIRPTTSCTAAKKDQAEENNDTSFCNLPHSSISQERHYLVDLARQDFTKAAALYDAKLEDWIGIVRDIQRFYNELQTSMKPVNVICGQYSEAVYRSWRQLCFFMECLYTEMEVERMALQPENKMSKFYFPRELQKYIKKSVAVRINKNFLHVKSEMHKIAKALKKLYNGNITFIWKYNQQLKEDQLKIAVPVLLLLHRQNRFFQLQQGKPLTSPMTPGLTAGLYGKEKSIQDRYLRWVQEPSKSAEKMITTYYDSRESSFASTKQCPTIDKQSHIIARSEAWQDHYTVQTNKSTVAALFSDINFDCEQAMSSLPDTTNSEQDAFKCHPRAINQLVTLQASKANSAAAAAALFHDKFTEWEARNKTLDRLFEGSKKKLLPCKNSKIDVIEFPVEDLKMLAWLCNSIELLHYETELERMALRPNNKKRTWLFSDVLTLKNHNMDATWRFSKPVCEVIGTKNKNKLSNKFNRLYKVLKRVAKFCCDIWKEHGKLIQLYNNTQVQEACLVRLPMMVSDVSIQVRDLIIKGNISETPLEQMTCLRKKTEMELSCHTQNKLDNPSSDCEGDYGACKLEEAKDNGTSPRTATNNQRNEILDRPDLLPAFVPGADMMMKEQDLESYDRLCSALILLKKARNVLKSIIDDVSEPGRAHRFEAQKNAPNRLTKLSKKLKLCSKHLCPRLNMGSRDYQMEEIPQYLHSAFIDFEEVTGVYSQAQGVLQRLVIAFQFVMKKLSPSFIQNLGIECSFGDDLHSAQLGSQVSDVTILTSKD